VGRGGKKDISVLKSTMDGDIEERKSLIQTGDTDAALTREGGFVLINSRNSNPNGGGRDAATANTNLALRDRVTVVIEWGWGSCLKAPVEIIKGVAAPILRKRKKKHSGWEDIDMKIRLWRPRQ